MKNNLLLAYLIAVLAASFALYQTAIMQKIPCQLCQLQRLVLFPLPLLLLICKERIIVYLIPLPALGLLFTLLQISKGLMSCNECYHVLSLPLGSALAFALILYFLLREGKRLKLKKEPQRTQRKP